MPDPVADSFYGDNEDYLRRLQEAEQTGECTFCDPEFQAGNRVHENGHRDEILDQYENWFAIRRSWPVVDRCGKDVANYILLIMEEHRPILTPLDVGNAWALARNIMAKLNIQGGGFAMRFGLPHVSGQAVIHPTAHVVEPRLGHMPNLDHPKDLRAIPFNFPIG